MRLENAPRKSARGTWSDLRGAVSKTSYLTRQCQHAVERFGSAQVVVGSLTRAAAAEIGGRDLGIPPAQIGTLHALCYRGLGRPELAQTPAGLAEWNEAHPHLRLSGGGRGAVEDDLGDEGETPCDEILQRVEVLRHRGTPVEAWPASVVSFAERWTAWKDEAGRLDFTDLLVVAQRELPKAPGAPRVLLLDEAQDFSALERRLVDQWSAGARTTVLAGDPLQALYTWRGADPRVLDAARVPEGHERVLAQSYRVPVRVRDLAMAWAGDLRPASYQYAARPAPGRVEYRPEWNWRQPERILDAVEAWVTAGEDVMLLGSCAYLLRPLVQVLRRAALPFANRYRRQRGDWNPLARDRGRGKVSTVDRLIAFLRPQRSVFGAEAHEWSREDVQLWVPLLRAEELLVRGAKKRVEQGDFPEHWSSDDLCRLFLGGADGHPLRALGGDLDWLLAHAMKGLADRLDYPLRVLRERGLSALTTEPKITVGSIHSVKGGEASHVVLFPDLSPRFHRAWMSAAESEEHRSVQRMVYVGATRARESLTVTGGGGPLALRELQELARVHATPEGDKR